MGNGYTGDVSPTEAWEILRNDPGSVLIDVRTAAEWQFVGVPDLSGIDKEIVLAEWITFPHGAPNPDFANQVKEAVGDDDRILLFLCRSGQRSQSAAAMLNAAGYPRCYNILEGFEGNKDATGHRGKVGGWKVANLPWIQG